MAIPVNESMNHFSADTIGSLAEQLGNVLIARHMYCAVAESCTGGLLAAAITDVPGSSRWFDRAFITYSNVAKEQMLAVPASTLLQHGAVSEQTAKAMVAGVLQGSKAEVGTAITGIAGPEGGSAEKPVGTVWIAWAGGDKSMHSHRFIFAGDRHNIRQQAVCAALQGLLRQC